jgi:hypothetical protein
MASERPDPFFNFAGKYGLRIATEDLSAAPRDVLAQPEDLERHVLVLLSGVRADAPAVHTLYVSEASDAREVSFRDVLWWLSADSWALEQAGRDYERWSDLYGYASDSPAALRLFRLHARQADSLRLMVGPDGYVELLRLYQEEVKASG